MNIIKIDTSINKTKNLLAFSGGVDSSALFFLLLENNINFDIAIVDYDQRVQSKDEVIYATQLAHKYSKKCFISTYPKDLKFSEKSARDFRHSFFDDIIKKDSYQSLITAHQLNDKLEWFLMQLTKGAGLVELIGMEKESFKNGYKVLKPVLEYSKEKLKEYLDNNNYKYFIDSTNIDEKYKRNYFRHNFSDKLIEKYEDGISKSFEYLQNDQKSLIGEVSVESNCELNIYTYKDTCDKNIAIRIIDKDLKKRGIIISTKARDEIWEKKELIVSHKIAVSIVENKIFIAPFVKVTMDKKFKDICRIDKIPKNIRCYLYEIRYNLAN